MKTITQLENEWLSGHHTLPQFIEAIQSDAIESMVRRSPFDMTQVELLDYKDFLQETLREVKRLLKSPSTDSLIPQKEKKA